MSKLTDYEGRTSCGCQYINQPDPGAHYPECLYRINSKAQPVSAQPAGEVPEVVGYGFRHVDKGWIFSTKFYHEVNPRLEGVGLMTVAQHTRIVAELQERAVVMPERRGLAYTDWRQWSEQDLGFNKALDEVARLNGGQFDPLEWSRKHGIEEY